MKLLWHRLSFWWFATMVPEYGPVTTINARETARKRRLFSSILLIAFLAAFLFTIQDMLSGTTLLQETEGMAGCCVPLCALWINRRGYLKCASSFYFLFALLTAFTSIYFLSLKIPVFSLYFWPVLLLLPVCSGLFLPAWGPLLLSMLEITFMYWFVHYGSRSQIALYLHDPAGQVQFLFLACILIFLAVVFSAIYAITTKKAVIQADRAVELEQAYAMLETAHATIQKQAVTDGLTGLPNHGAIVEQIEAELLRCQGSQRNCAIIFVDIDHFKRINDTWGHAAGDAALHEVGQRLREGIRRDDYAGRYGGEEFAILLSDIELSEAFDLAERLRCSIAGAPCLWQQKETQSVTPIPLTASFGLATYPLDGLTAGELLDVADTAMYTAKHTGRNRVCLPDEVEVAALKEDQDQQLPRYSEQSVLQTMATMATWHDRETQAHANRMIRLAEATMRVLGRSEDEVVLLCLAAQLHDIGKIGIPQAILQKPDSLSEDEWVVMRRHPQIGQQILAQAKGYFGLVSHIIVAHHERWDGQGYPYRLAGQEIPLGARILCVIDAFDAMTSSRPYREALSRAAARAELQRCAGTQFDPQVVDAFLQVLQAHEPPASIALTPASV